LLRRVEDHRPHAPIVANRIARARSFEKAQAALNDVFVLELSLTVRIRGAAAGAFAGALGERIGSQRSAQ
jgi:hypothetical protein